MLHTQHAYASIKTEVSFGKKLLIVFRLRHNYLDLLLANASQMQTMLEGGKFFIQAFLLTKNLDPVN